MSEQYKQKTERLIALDRAYIAGLKTGWNLGVVEDRSTFNRIQQERIKQIASEKRDN